MYFNFPPFKNQYILPGEIFNYPSLMKIFVPYTYAGKILWNFFRSLPFLKYLTKIDEKGLPVNRKELKNALKGNDWIYAINTGTKWEGQKTTLIALNKLSGVKYIIKIADSEKARNMLLHEIDVLKKLRGIFNNAPEAINEYSSGNKLFCVFSHMYGDRYTGFDMDLRLIEVIAKINKLNIASKNYYRVGNLQYAFGHGDFCPWNLLIEDDKINVFDWEMAGYYPFGYDLFTFIFQTSLLLRPKTSIGTLLKRNNRIIETYFNSMNIKEWDPYLKAFASVKLDFEKEKSESTLRKYYEKLFAYGK